MKTMIIMPKNIIVMVFFMAFTYNGFSADKKSLSNIQQREILDRVLFNPYVGTSFGPRNFNLIFGAEALIFDRLSLGVQSGFNFLSYKIFSGSDKHRIRLFGLPYSFHSKLYLFQIGDARWFLYGNYGKTIYSRGVKTDFNRNYPTNTYEVGLGVRLPANRNHITMFVGQFYTQAQGTHYSTYDSEIDFTLNIYTIKFGFTFDFGMSKYGE